MTEIRVYFEGDPRLRQAFGDFFRELVEAARQRGRSLQFIAGKGNTIRTFMKGLRANPSAKNFLLIDCEGPGDRCTLAALRTRSDWTPPRGTHITESQILRMVQVMESWFLADKEALVTYYGDCLSRGRLPANPKTEAVPKDDVLKGLKEATRTCHQKGPYHKGAHAPEILRRLNPATVKQACPACRRAFQEIQRQIES